MADDSPGWEQRWDEREAIEDDRLRLVFTCCHPSLSEEARIALTLREVCGLTTEAIAAAFLVAPPTLAQRIVRAKAKIAAARIPYEVPGAAERPARLASVLRVVYLVFNEGHATQAAALADEAIRLARLLHALLPEPEVLGLLALLLLHDARRAARSTDSGDLVPLEAQDRSLWNHDAIAEGCALARTGLVAARLRRLRAAGRDRRGAWRGRERRRHRLAPDRRPVRRPAAHRAQPGGRAEPRRGGGDARRARGRPGADRAAAARPVGLPRAPAAAADLCRRAGRRQEAQAHYRAAAALARQEPERRFLLRKLAELGG